MAKTRTEIQQKSDEKRGVKVKGLKMSLDDIALLERLAEQLGKPQATIVADALHFYAEALDKK
ncbi:hypothetical protein KRX19_05535 [Cardiobacteriaceae bacterium TAE3-ERU3]|nr:hypothetical protein [Cardiobacteriaceae bacterium TAE3-ERU3]